MTHNSKCMGCFRPLIYGASISSGTNAVQSIPCVHWEVMHWAQYRYRKGFTWTRTEANLSHGCADQGYGVCNSVHMSSMTGGNRRGDSLVHLGNCKWCIKSGASDMVTIYPEYSEIILVHTYCPGITINSNSIHFWSQISGFGYYILRSLWELEKMWEMDDELKAGYIQGKASELYVKAVGSICFI